MAAEDAKEVGDDEKQGLLKQLAADGQVKNDALLTEVRKIQEAGGKKVTNTFSNFWNDGGLVAAEYNNGTFYGGGSGGKARQ